MFYIVSTKYLTTTTRRSSGYSMLSGLVDFHILLVLPCFRHSGAGGMLRGEGTADQVTHLNLLHVGGEMGHAVWV